MKEIIVIGGCGIGHTEAINSILRERGMRTTMVAFHSLQAALEDLDILFADHKTSAHNINLLAEKINPNYIYEKPQSKFISRPLNNFRTR